MTRLLPRALATTALVCLPMLTRAQLADRPLFVESRIPMPPAVASARGGDFLIYEIHATNFEAKPLTWTGAEVVDGSSGATLAVVRDSALARSLLRPGLRGVPLAEYNVVAPGMRAVLYLQVPLANGARPASIAHRLTFNDSTGSRTLAVPAVAVVGDVAVIGPPLRGGPWYAANGPGNTSGHRRTVITLEGKPRIAQRFAIDYVKLDSTFQTHRGDALNNANYYAEDLDVIAVADGVVAAVKDSIPENVPGANSRAVPISLVTVGGNHVILDIGKGRYAFYAHLRPRSIRVKVGDKVKKGAVLAKLGNSGNSTEPHLHFHLGDANRPLESEGIPYVHESVEFIGTCVGFGNKCQWTSAESKRRVMPFDNDIVRYP